MPLNPCEETLNQPSALVASQPSSILGFWFNPVLFVWRDHFYTLLAQIIGSTNGSETAWTSARIQAGNQVQIDSGGNTELKGASARAHQVTTAIDGDLIIESLQDESYYDSKQKSAGGGFSVGIGATGVSGNLSLGRTNIRSDYVSANEQSGIQAGDGGFQVNVLGRTELIGGAITSTQQAVDSGANQFDSQSGVVLSDLENRARYDARGYAINAGVGTHGQNYNPSTQSGIGLGVDEDSARSTTRAGISGIAGNVSARTGDAETGLKPIFDAERVQNEIDAQIAITQEFGKQAPKAWANYAVQQQREALAHNDFETAQKWGEGGEYRVAGHTLLGGLSGDVAGATGALISASLMPTLGAELDKTDLPDPVKQALGLVAAGTLGAIAGSGGAAMAVNVEANNRQLHPDEVRWLEQNADAFAEQQNISKERALQRLSQQALKQVDYLWRAQLSDGDDEAAKAFLSTDTTFTNDLEKPQRLFIAEGQQLFRPELHADTADPKFYQRYAAVGISQPLADGLRREMKDSGIALKDGAVDFGEAIVNNPRQAVDAIYEAIAGLPEGVKDGMEETGQAIGEGAATTLNRDLQNKLNDIYGKDVSAYQQSLLLIRTVTAVTGAAGAGKAAGHVTEATAEALGKKLDEIAAQAAEKALLKNAGVVDADGNAMLDLKQLTNQQKAVLGDLFGADTVRKIVPDGEKLARIPGPGETGIDDLYKVNRDDVDYVIIEYKFVGDYSKKGSSVLGNTADGKQGAESWTNGSDRIENAVGREAAPEVRESVRNGRIETWVVTTRPNGATEIEVLDAFGKPKDYATSKLLPSTNLSRAQP